MTDEDYWREFARIMASVRHIIRMTRSRKRRPGRKPAFVDCRYCGRRCTLTEQWIGHDGCKRKKVARPRNYVNAPGKPCGPHKPREKEIIIKLDREEIRRRIEAMGTSGPAALVARLFRSYRA